MGKYGINWDREYSRRTFGLGSHTATPAGTDRLAASCQWKPADVPSPRLLPQHTHYKSVPFPCSGLLVWLRPRNRSMVAWRHQARCIRLVSGQKAHILLNWLYIVHITAWSLHSREGTEKKHGASLHGCSFRGTGGTYRASDACRCTHKCQFAGSSKQLLVRERCGQQPGNVAGDSITTVRTLGV